MRFAFIERYRSRRWTVALMCEVLEVSRSGYYRWLSRPRSARDEANETLSVFLLERAAQMRGIPGYRKLWLEAVDAGYACGKNRVQRVLQAVGYRSSTAPRPSHRRPTGGIVLPNVLARQFEVDAPNRVWVSDITQIRCQEGWLYEAIVLDLYGRRIVGRAAGRQNNAQLVLAALRQAWQDREPEGARLLFHSDQGAQYTAKEVQHWLARRQVKLSMSRVGNCWDNACAESYFAHLKKEWIRPLGLIKRSEMIGELKYYTETYYNQIRRHSQAGDLPPAVFEAQQNGRLNPSVY